MPAGSEWLHHETMPAKESDKQQDQSLHMALLNCRER